MSLHRFLRACTCLLALLFPYCLPVTGNTQVNNPIQLALMDIMENKPAPGKEPALARPVNLSIDQHVMELYARREMRPL